MTDLVAQLVAVSAGLSGAGIPHAFGGAVALAYCTGEPRGTRDLDVNVFVDTGRASEVFAALPDGVAHTAKDLTAVRRDGQVRLWWDETPVDLFFDQHALHRAAALTARDVPFAGTSIPVLSCTALAVFKTLFARPKNWVDLEEMKSAGSFDKHEVIGWVAEIVGAEDDRLRRLLDL